MVFILISLYLGMESHYCSNRNIVLSLNREVNYLTSYGVYIMILLLLPSILNITASVILFLILLFNTLKTIMLY